MSGRKTFTAGEVLQAADVNDFLMDQSVMVFAGTAARGSAIPSPTEGMVTYLQDTDEVQVYTTSWGAIAGGKILQVVSTTKTDSFSASVAGGGTSSVTGLTASITPSATSSKIFVMASVTGAAATPLSVVSLILTRGGTPIGVGTTAGNRVAVSAQTVGSQSGTQMGNTTASFLDSPSSTSSLTYGVDIHSVNSSTQNYYVNRTPDDSDFAYVARAASTITVMEVAG